MHIKHNLYVWIQWAKDEKFIMTFRILLRICMYAIEMDLRIVTWVSNHLCWKAFFKKRLQCSLYLSKTILIWRLKLWEKNIRNVNKTKKVNLWKPLGLLNSTSFINKCPLAWVERTFSFDFAGGRPRVCCCENLGVGGVWHYVLVSLLLLAFLVISIIQLTIYG